MNDEYNYDILNLNNSFYTTEDNIDMSLFEQREYKSFNEWYQRNSFCLKTR